MRNRFFTAILVLLVVAPASVVIASDRGGEPGPPEWVDAKGRVDQAKLRGNPTIGVSGPDGNLVVCKNGKELRVKVKDLLAPPLPPTGNVPADPPAEGYVYRCGRGENPHLNAERVPASE